MRAFARRLPVSTTTSTTILNNHRNLFTHTPLLMGVVRNVLTAGTGAIPNKGDKITVHCTGYVQKSATERSKFWSTLDTNEPFAFNVGLGQVIKGWDEGMLQMAIGEESELTMTPDYGYGAKGFPAWGIPPNATLTFVIKMLKIN